MINNFDNFANGLQVQNAVEARDHDEIERLCQEGLEDPFLPPLFRAEFHVMLAL